MSDNKEWKNNLLASSLPLEYEVAKILATKGFAVDADYTYSRLNEHGNITDFSTDINAKGYFPLQDENEILCDLDILIECKFRVRGTKWLFLEDPSWYNFSPIILGYTINEIDDFSLLKMKNKNNIDFEKKLNYAYKCVEIKDKQVYDKEIKHSISQLRYAMPKLLIQNIKSNLLAYGSEDNVPFVHTAIIVTTADLLLANNDFSIEKVENSSDIEEFTSKVPYLVYYSDYSPDFEKHCDREFDELNWVLERNKSREKNILSPKGVSICKDLINGHHLNYFNQFLICNINEFPKLLDIIIRIVNKDMPKSPLTKV